jgi:hypothetical protein
MGSRPHALSSFSSSSKQVRCALLGHHSPSTHASAASAWGSQNVIAMSR